MSKLFYKAMIEVIQNDPKGGASQKCTDAELEALLNAFEYTVKKMTTTLAHKAWYVATAKQ